MSTNAQTAQPSTSNPLPGILSGGTSGRTDMTWANLTSHERAVAWGQINDVFMQILGRSATQADAQKYYNMGISNYALGQQLMMTKEFTHTQIFAQLQRGYAYALQQFVGGGFKLSTKLAQSFAAHNYTTTDLQAWVYAHPHVYVHSNDYQTRVSQMRDVYQSVFGIDPYAAGNLGNHPVDVQQRVDTNKKQPGIQGHAFNTVTVQRPNDPLLAHIQQAALHFQTPDQYKAFLMQTPVYRQQALARVAPTNPADAGLTLDSRGRPVQQGLGGMNRSGADIPQ